MPNRIDIAIIGAGPYGLSLAAHLRKTGADSCVFGAPMNTWLKQMPPGMHLKSDGFACDLSDPDGAFTLAEFCRLNDIPYADRGLPVSLDTFVSYGAAFQRRFVPNLDPRVVADVSRDGTGFRISFDKGEDIWARYVVVAVGLTQFARIPEPLSRLPTHLLSHSSQCENLKRFRDRDVVVVGGGSSAVDIALSLNDAGARVQLVTRGEAVHFHGKAADKRSLLTRIRNPWSGLGPGWPSRLACDLPLLFHCMPREFRLRIVKKHLGPAPGWFTREPMVRHVPMHVGLSLSAAGVTEGRVHLRFKRKNGEQEEIFADHVVAGTGYRIDIARLRFLRSSLFAEIETEENSPILSSNFEASTPGIYFIGPCAAYSFGPLLRFTFGASFVSQRLSRHLGARVRRSRKGCEEQVSNVELTFK